MTRTKRTAMGVFAVFISSQAVSALAQSTATATAPTSAGGNATQPAPSPPTKEQIEQLVAPIALYPDSLLTQILMASTYPVEVVTADRFAKANPKLTGDALTTQLEKQNWDASVKSLVNFPTVLAMMSDKLDLTVKLGDTFLADEKGVMDAVQRLRTKAKDQGSLETTKEQKIIVETAPATQTQVIRIEPSDPQVIYVPSYNPAVVYGTWPYPAYPPVPYYPPGYAFTAGVIGFGLGVAAGAAWGYAWGNCNWGGGDVDIDVNRNANFNRNIDRSKYQNQINQLNNRAGNAGNRQGGWQHDPSHRQGVAYRDQNAAQKFGGASSRDAVQSREAFRGRADAGRQQISNGAADQFRGAGAPRPSGGQLGGGSAARPNAGPAGGARPSAGPARPSAAPARPSASPARPSTPQNRGSSGLSGAGGGGAAARSASQRGAASRAPARSAGGARGGGGGGRR